MIHFKLQILVDDGNDDDGDDVDGNDDDGDDDDDDSWHKFWKCR